MKIEELLGSLRDKLQENSDVAAYCQEKYGKGHTVFLGVDEDNPPQQSDYPIVVIFHLARAARGESSKYVTYQALIGVGIINETVDKIQTGRVTLVGNLEVEHLRELVEAAIFKSGIAPKIDVSGETSTEIIFPLFRSDTIVELQFIQSSRNSVS